MSINLASTAASGAVSSISALGSLLQYGFPGLALALMILTVYSLRSLQQQALTEGVPIEKIRPFVSLQYAYLVAVVLLLGATLAVQFLRPDPVNPEHNVAFMLSPTRFESAEVAPRMQAANGGRVEIRDGVGRDRFAGDRAYQIDLGGLTKQVDDLKLLLLKQGLTHSAQGGNDGR